MRQISAPIISSEEVTSNTHLVWIDAAEIASSGQPGQFVTIYCENLLLRRPFSIHQVNSTQFAILFKVVGEGTTWLSRQREGDRIDVLGPLGAGFNITPSARNLLMVAGGIGLAPLIFLAQRALPRHAITLIHGASTSADLYPPSLLRPGSPGIPSHLFEEIRFIPVTEDGSAGEKGMSTSILPRFLNWADQIFACGPAAMYQAMARIPLPTQENKLKMETCQVSLETIMGCGIGACYGCTINTRKGTKRVCRDGPVFRMDDILWQEVKI